jgi:hypothetical protein
LPPNVSSMSPAITESIGIKMTMIIE